MKQPPAAACYRDALPVFSLVEISAEQKDTGESPA